MYRMLFYGCDLGRHRSCPMEPPAAEERQNQIMQAGGKTRTKPFPPLSRLSPVYVARVGFILNLLMRKPSLREIN